MAKADFKEKAETAHICCQIESISASQGRGHFTNKNPGFRKQEPCVIPKGFSPLILPPGSRYTYLKMNALIKVNVYKNQRKVKLCLNYFVSKQIIFPCIVSYQESFNRRAEGGAGTAEREG